MIKYLLLLINPSALNDTPWFNLWTIHQSNHHFYFHFSLLLIQPVYFRHSPVYSIIVFVFSPRFGMKALLKDFCMLCWARPGWACCVYMAYRERSHKSGARRGGQRLLNQKRVKVISPICALCVRLCICVCVWGAEAKEVDERGKARPRVGGEPHVNILRATGLILGNICLSW